MELLFIIVIFLLGFIQIFLIIQIFLCEVLKYDSLAGLSDYIDSHPMLRFLNVYKHQTIHITRTRKLPSKKKDIFPFYSFKVLFFGGFGLFLEGDFLLGVIVLLLEIKTGFLIQLALPVLYNYEHLFYLLRTDYTPNTNMDIFLAQRLRLIPRQQNYESIKKSIYSQMNTKLPLYEKWTAPKMYGSINEINLKTGKIFNMTKIDNRIETRYKRPDKSIWPNTEQYESTPFAFTYDEVEYRCVIIGITFESPKQMWEFNVQECVKLLRAGEPIPVNTTNAILRKALKIYKNKGYDNQPLQTLLPSKKAKSTNDIYHSAVTMRAIERTYDVSNW